MCLYSNRSQKTWKWSKNHSDTVSCTLCATFLFLLHIDVICDLLLYIVSLKIVLEEIIYLRIYP